jgi:perosamine synthetase
MIDWWSTSFGQGEIDSISEAIHNKNISQGKVNALLEESFAKSLNVKYAVTSPNGTQAILIALHAVGVRGGDEVIVSSLTAIGTANAIFGLGAKPVFIDSSLQVPNIDISQIPGKINSKTKAIVVVHYNGISVDIEKLKNIADKYKIPVIEDAAQAMFSKREDRYLGTFFKAGTYSFAASKIISSGQGGITVTNDEQIYDSMRRLKIQDRDDYDTPSFNMKFTDIQAAMLLPQLANISVRVGRLKEIYGLYKSAFEKLDQISMVGNSNEDGELPLWAIAKCENRDQLYSFMVSRNIKPLKWPRPLNEAKWFNSTGEFHNSSQWSSTGLRLPCGPSRNLADIEKTIETIYDFYSGSSI